MSKITYIRDTSIIRKFQLTNVNGMEEFNKKYHLRTYILKDFFFQLNV